MKYCDGLTVIFRPEHSSLYTHLLVNCLRERVKNSVFSEHCQKWFGSVYDQNQIEKMLSSEILVHWGVKSYVLNLFEAKNWLSTKLGETPFCIMNPLLVTSNSIANQIYNFSQTQTIDVS